MEKNRGYKNFTILAKFPPPHYNWLRSLNKENYKSFEMHGMERGYEENL